MAKKPTVKDLEEKGAKYLALVGSVLMIVAVFTGGLLYHAKNTNDSIESLQSQLSILEEQQSRDAIFDYEETVFDCGAYVLHGQQSFDGSGVLVNSSVFFKEQGGVFQGDFARTYYDRSTCQEITREWRKLTSSQNLTMKGFPINGEQ